MKRLVFRFSLALAMTLTITPTVQINVAYAVTAVDAANEATDAANAAADAAALAASAAESINLALRDRVDSALVLANSSGVATIIDISSEIIVCNNVIISVTSKRDFAKNRYDEILIILGDATLESSIRSGYTSASKSWSNVVNIYQRVIDQIEREKLYLNSIQVQINKAAADKAAADKAAADKAAADKAAADKAAADKAAADKAAADKAAADKAAADKTSVEKDAAIAALTAKVNAIEAKLAAAKKTTIICVKGKISKKVTAVRPKCPSGYKIKK